AGSFQHTSVIQRAYNLNFPLHVVPPSSAQCPAWSAFSVSSPAVVLETAEDRPDAVVVRLYGVHDSMAVAWLQTSLSIKDVMRNCDLLEQPAAQGSLLLEQQGLGLPFMPFSVLSVFLVLRQ
ncbi:MA2C1 mannosidase, partial [Bucorvus abyssinicus]|nr:MA2C1 mannosidase [Bucorvus abyssinicus]